LKFTDLSTPTVLSYLSAQDDVILILWSSSHETEIAKVREWLETFKINIQFINENPLEDNTEYADFSKKFYFNVILDDKAGFDPSVDWLELENWAYRREVKKLRDRLHNV
jgi:2-methylcitrate dehydratase PrpD